MRVADAVVGLVRGDRAAALDALRMLVAELVCPEDAFAGASGGASAEHRPALAAATVVIVQRCPDCGGPHGRPVVMAPTAARHVGVSIAHAGERHVVASVRGLRIGVDAEHRAARAERLEALRTLFPDAADPLRRWTQVEAVLKADGRGLRLEPSAVVLEPQTNGLEASVAGSSRRYAVHDVEIDPALVVSLAIEVLPAQPR